MPWQMEDTWQGTFFSDRPTSRVQEFSVLETITSPMKVSQGHLISLAHILDSNAGAVHPPVSRTARHKTPFRLIPVFVEVSWVHLV